MKIAIIGPGYQDIPSPGWGAVESVIWALVSRLRQRGYEVDLYNNPHIKDVVESINSRNYDFVHCEYDDYVGILSQHCNKPVWGTTHYGMIKTWRNHNPGYGYIHQGVLSATGGLLALSSEIADIYRRDGFKNPIYVLRNGADTKTIRFSETPVFAKALCLGKIEPRKAQARLARLCEGKVEIDFVGPMHDPSFRENSTCKWLGEWTREEVCRNMTDYSCLVLASEGEAAPLVAPEAIAAGLPLVITPTCNANLDNFCGQYIDWANPEQIPERINYAIRLGKNPENRKFHREWAEKYFSWDIIVDEYVNIIQEIVNKK